jgi:hypothetical protein
MNGIELIAKERQRQIEKEGFTAEYDDRWKKSELAYAAATYAITDGDRHYRILMPKDENWKGLGDVLWQWEKKWFKPTPADRIKELVKAGALIAAEIDRLQRLNNG